VPYHDSLWVAAAAAPVIALAAIVSFPDLYGPVEKLNDNLTRATDEAPEIEHEKALEGNVFLWLTRSAEPNGTEPGGCGHLRGAGPSRSSTWACR
jgi:hypothetical protein